MSIVKSSSVFCDINDESCKGWIAETVDGSAAARRIARAAGWVRRDGKDICPGCDPKHVHRFDPVYQFEPCRCGTFRSEVT